MSQGAWPHVSFAGGIREMEFRRRIGAALERVGLAIDGENAD